MNSVLIHMSLSNHYEFYYSPVQCENYVSVLLQSTYVFYHSFTNSKERPAKNNLDKQKSSEILDIIQYHCFI